MAFLSGFNVTLDKAKLLGEAAMASFAGAPIPGSWTVVTPAALGLGSNYQDGNYYRDGATGASAIVLRQGNDYIVAFRGTDGAIDTAYYPELFFGTYINHFSPLLNALAAQAPVGALFSFTGASLGGGATNNLAAIADNAYGGRYTDATFVAFASPNISNANGILNLGVENDPVYKSVSATFPFTQYQDYASSIDNLVLANDSYVAGSLSNMDAHSAKSGFDVFGRLSNSRFYDLMSPDSPIVIADSNGVIQDLNPGRTTTGAFYLGRSVADQIVGRGGNDYIEGFDGNDNLDGGAGSDKIDGGAGGDTINGGTGNDTLYGGDGNDALIGGAGIDFVDGGNGIDTYTFFAGAAVVNMNTGTASWSGSPESFVNIENISAGSGNDTITGDSGANVIDGGAGSDSINGGAGNDSLYGGTGNDTLIGAAGIDFVDGGSGIDTYAFSAGDAVVNMNTGIATWAGSPESFVNIENISAGSGNDTLTGNGIVNVIDGGAGKDTINGGGSGDTLKGGAGNDTFVFRAGEANGDIITDFAGNGTSLGDQLQFLGYGTAAQGASFVRIDSTHWQINSFDGVVHNVITLSNGASIHTSDFLFV